MVEELDKTKVDDLALVLVHLMVDLIVSATRSDGP